MVRLPPASLVFGRGPARLQPFWSARSQWLHRLAALARQHQVRPAQHPMAKICFLAPAIAARKAVAGGPRRTRTTSVLTAVTAVVCRPLKQHPLPGLGIPRPVDQLGPVRCSPDDGAVGTGVFAIGLDPTVNLTVCDGRRQVGLTVVFA